VIYCFVCKDGPQAASLRKDLLQAHLKHIEGVVSHMPVAGPMRDSDGNFIGSILMIEADTEDEARNLFNQDPYAKVKIWDSIEVFPFDAVAGTWVGGVSWQNPLS
jgi:uncharacterized protein YciI